MNKKKPNHHQLNQDALSIVFPRRLFAAHVIVVAGCALLFGRFFYLQVIKHDELRTQAILNQTEQIPIEPARGLITDRHGLVLARDNPGYSLEIAGADPKTLDALLQDIQTIIPLSPKDIKAYQRLRAETDRNDSVPIRAKLTEEEVARFSVEQYRFKNVFIKKRSFREYPNLALGVHAIGYVGRINQRDKERIQKEGLIDTYRGTSHIGKTGIEQKYEAALHGQNGYERLEVMASGKPVGVLEEVQPVQGNNLELTLDAHIQATAEKAYAGRRGALVALNPKTGEVLAFVSAPTYDPNLFVEGISFDAYKELTESKNKPLFNRALMGAYPPGSTYKPFMAIAALHSGARSRDEVIHDGGIFILDNHKYRDSTGGRGHGSVNMFTSIAVSSDVYYYSLAHKMGVDLMYQELSRFGFGERTGLDLVGEEKGILPSREWYKQRTGRDWVLGQTVSLGIGQGENTFPMIQLASALGAIANNGVRMRPYMMRAAIHPMTGERKETQPTQIADLAIPQEDVDLVKRAMVQVNISGTGRGIFNGLPGKVAGKTGTAQVFSVSQNSTYKESMRGESMRDHSLYIAMYPADDPQIVIACIVENGGFGSDAAAPLVRETINAFVASQNGHRFVLNLPKNGPNSTEATATEPTTGPVANPPTTPQGQR